MGLMDSLVPVRIGDLIEFSSSLNEATVEGRVMDVNHTSPNLCSVQTSPYEPFRKLDLSQLLYKIIYSVGDLTNVTTTMVGQQIEIILGGSDKQKGIEMGIIKQVDYSLNCALISFDDGRKDWRDLTMNAFRIVGNRSLNFNQTTADTVISSATALPTVEATEFDWYTDGGHVELCDPQAHFIEGALLCSHLNDSTLQLYNENRQFFSIKISQQSFKVVIHGLSSLKSIPLGQAVEIYSPMHGSFRLGSVMKAAELGKLTPVKFADVGLEWLDLTSQTFKLVFLTEEQLCHATDADSNLMEAPPDHRVEMVPAFQPKSPHQAQLDIQTNRQKISLPLPVLFRGQTIELQDPTTKQFMKHVVTEVHHPKEAYHYEVDYSASDKSGASLLRSSHGKSVRSTINLAKTKARIQIQVDHWNIYKPILVGYRADIYEKADRSVISGKIVECSDDENCCRIHVKLNDGSMKWVDLKPTKVKIRLHGDSKSSWLGSIIPVDQPSQHLIEGSMWRKVDAQEAHKGQEANLPQQLRRQHSIHESQHTESASDVITRHASLPVMTRGVDIERSETVALTISRIPSLDFTTLHRSQSEADKDPIRTSGSSKVEPPTETQRSEALSDLLPPMDDVWFEKQIVIDDATVTEYVHCTTGKVQVGKPQWLRAEDHSFILNTITGVKFQLGGTEPSKTPKPSDRVSEASVGLPVGPLEAVRIVNQIATAFSNDVCTQAFGN